MSWQSPLLLDVHNKKTGKSLQYRPATPEHLDFHQAPEDNIFLWGKRGTGKSVAIRNDAHMRALTWPGFTYLVLRRTKNQVHQNHIRFLYQEKEALGADWNTTRSELVYPTDPPSVGYYMSADDENALENVLGAEYGCVYIDEAPNFPWEWIVRIGGSLRVPDGAPYRAMMRLAGNPIGISIQQIHSYYIERDVDPEDDPEYDPSQFRAIKALDNPHIDWDKYRRRFAGSPAHIRRAWLDGEMSFGGKFFEEFSDAHMVDAIPNLHGALVYRTIDWGWFPDPTVCLWVAVYPDGSEVVFKERLWTKTTARDVAAQIAQEGAYRVRTTFCDPSMWDNDKATGASIGRLIQGAGIPLSASKNDREAAALAIHEHLGQRLENGLPKLRIYAAGCPKLVKQLQSMVVDPKKPERIPDGDDHSVIALGYFCMGDIRAPLGPSEQKRLEQAIHDASSGPRIRLGRESTRIGSLLR